MVIMKSMVTAVDQIDSAAQVFASQNITTTKHVLIFFHKSSWLVLATATIVALPTKVHSQHVGYSSLVSGATLLSFTRWLSLLQRHSRAAIKRARQVQVWMRLFDQSWPGLSSRRLVFVTWWCPRVMGGLFLTYASELSNIIDTKSMMFSKI